MIPKIKSFSRLRKRLTFKSTVLCLSFGLCFWIIILLISERIDSRSSIENEIKIDLSNNYFQKHDKLMKGNFLVDTAQCRIPDVDIWDSELRPLVGPPEDYKCGEKFVRLTYVEKDTVVIDEEALEGLGYTLEQIECCYRSVERVEQTLESFDKDADNLFRYSETCIPMGWKTKSIFMFIQVTCKPRNLVTRFIPIYTNFHMLAVFPEDNLNISRKLHWWENCLSSSVDENCVHFREKGRPPNVLVLGLDSTSRGNVHRFLPKTIEVLENVIQAVEMVGFNKVGENTLPNFAPLSTSFSREELKKLCWFNKHVPFDNCPFIWKKFSARNYLTAHLEDAPGIAIFNYFKTGFVYPPVDIYGRPLMLAAYDGDSGIKDCLGYQRPEEMVLNFISDFVELAEQRKAPYFLISWLTDLTHDKLSNLQLVDKLMAQILQNLMEKGLLENTLFLLIGDHGYRFQEIRVTAPGWFEDKLPTLWIKPGSSLLDNSGDQSSWMETLKSNSKMLTTPYDIHATFQEILDTYWLSFPPDPPQTQVVIPANRGVSLFTKIPPTRTCDQAGIPQDFCACIPPTPCKQPPSFIKSAAIMAVEKSINAILPPECSQLQVDTVTACGTIDRRLKDKSGGVEEIIVLVALNTTPGNFLFEAMAHYDTSQGRFTNAYVLGRMNKKNQNTMCMVNYDDWIELLCHCTVMSIIRRLCGFKLCGYMNGKEMQWIAEMTRQKCLALQRMMSSALHAASDVETESQFSIMNMLKSLLQT